MSICPKCGKERCPMCEGKDYRSCWTYLTDKENKDPDCYFLENDKCRLDKNICPYVDSRDFDNCEKLNK